MSGYIRKTIEFSNLDFPDRIHRTDILVLITANVSPIARALVLVMKLNALLMTKYRGML
jgi:hypothetical protein